MDNSAVQAIDRFSLYNSPVAVISVNDAGPFVLLSTLTPELMNMETLEEVSNYLDNLSVSVVVTIGQGHEYTAGTFEFPCIPNPAWRLFIISSRIRDLHAADDRLQMGYFHVILFLPFNFMKHLNYIQQYELGVLDIVKRNFTYAQEITAVNLNKLKKEVIDYLFTKTFYA